MGSFTPDLNFGVYSAGTMTEGSLTYRTIQYLGDGLAPLFSSGAPGDYWDFSDLTTLFQDTAGTTPVTAAGQPVARVNGKLGRIPLTQPTAGHRPTWSALPNGKMGLLFNGTDSALFNSSIDMSAADALSIIFAARRTANPATAAVMMEFSPSDWSAGNGTFISSLSSTGTTNFGLKGTVSSQPAGPPAFATPPVSYILGGRGDISDSAVEFWANGALYNRTTTSLGTGNLGNHQLWVGKRNPAGGTTFPYTGYLTGALFIGKYLSNAEMVTASDWGNARLGAY